MRFTTKEKRQGGKKKRVNKCTICEVHFKKMVRIRFMRNLEKKKPRKFIRFEEIEETDIEISKIIQ